MENQQPNSQLDWEKILNRINLLVTVAAACFALWISFQFTPIEKKLGTIEKQMSIDQAKLSFDRDFEFKVFDKVIDAIKSNNQTQVVFAVAYTREMLSPDDPLRLTLLKAISNSTTLDIPDTLRSELKTEVANEQKFNTQQKQLVNQPVVESSNWRVDIFYLENYNDSSSYRKAKAASERISSQYTVRVRLLPASVNMRSGYKVAANEIRFEADEQSEAKKLKSMLEDNGGMEFSYHQTSQVTAHYLSVFIVQ